ncbi:MAG: cytochrome c [Phycisphaerales bacterium]|nr:cytochrome c [Phycisphaerales bacterium]
MDLAVLLILVGLHTAPPGTAPGPSWHGDAQDIINRKCLTCHRDGGVGPFPLETYKDVTKRSRMIAEVVSSGLMPPWHATPTPEGQESPWQNDQSLTAREKDVLLAWLTSDQPLGDPSAAPASPTFRSEWSIGTPDLVFDFGDPIAVPAEGTMPYVYRTTEMDVTTDSWVSAWEVLPSDPSVVHHVLVFLLDADSDARPSDTRGFFAAYVPGLGSRVYQPGQAKQLPAGSRLLFQVHYTPNGKAATDQTRVGIRLAEEPPEHEVYAVGIADRRLSIPPGAAAHEEGTSLTVPRAVHVLSVMPHMHLRGAAFQAELEAPDGTRRTLLEVPNYDFNWQLSYQFKDPPLVQRGETLHITGTFDNSEANPANPDPGRRVRWGRQTEDEMLICYVEYVRASLGDRIRQPGR